MIQQEIRNPARDPEQQRLENYAKLTAGPWANIQEGQEVFIKSESVNSRLVEEIRKAAFARGAREVFIKLEDKLALRQRILSETTEQLSAPDQELAALCKRIADNRGAFIRVEGPAKPGIFSDLDPQKCNALDEAQGKDFEPLRRIVMSGQTNRCVIAEATPGWAKHIFPELPEDIAYERLKAAISQACFLDREDPLKAFLDQSNQLEEKREILKSLDLRRLRFEGEGTDLLVGLTELAVWLGGVKQTTGGLSFFANVPIGEIFTTPDLRLTEGRVRITLPSFLSDTLVTDAWFEFTNGQVTNFGASKGREIIEQFLNREPANRYLGEIALVSMDSPLAMLEIVFQSVLLDEKARSHFALGKGYLTNIRDGYKLSAEEQSRWGINDSKSHHDFMISDAGTRVTGITARGDAVVLLENGLWAI